jgi:hypothetical protein
MMVADKLQRLATLEEVEMSKRFGICALLLIVIAVVIVSVGCAESSSPSTTTAPSQTCVFSLSTGAIINGYPNGGSFVMAVTTLPASGCNWTATSQASWIHVPAGAASSGTGAFTFTVDANPGAARSGTLTVAGQIVVFNQSAQQVTTGPAPAPTCTYSLSVGSTVNGYPSGGTFPVAVTTTPSTGCSWTAVSNATWIHVTNGASGSGSGTFTFVVDPDAGPARAGTLTAAGEIVVFNQSSEGAQ